MALPVFPAASVRFLHRGFLTSISIGIATAALLALPLAATHPLDETLLFAAVLIPIGGLSGSLLIIIAALVGTLLFSPGS